MTEHSDPIGDESTAASVRDDAPKKAGPEPHERSPEFWYHRAAELLADGYSYTRIRNILMEESGRIQTTVEKWIKKARERIIPEVYKTKETKHMLALAIARALRLNEHAVDMIRGCDGASDRAAAMRVSAGQQRLIAELQGLTATFAVQQLKQTVGAEKFARMGRKELIETLVGMVGADELQRFIGGNK